MILAAALSIVIIGSYGHSSSSSYPYELECIQSGQEGDHAVFSCKPAPYRPAPKPEESPTGWRCVPTYKFNADTRPLLFCKSSISGASKIVIGDFIQ
jgi:hypothetical protein